MLKKPSFRALAAVAYIILIVFGINRFSVLFPEETIFIPMVMLSLFVLSAAVMAFLFFYEPFRLYIDGKKEDALKFFGKILGFFALFTVIFFVLILALR